MGSGLPGGSDDGSAAGPSDASVRDLRDERRELPLPRVHEDQNRERHQEAQRRQERKLIPSQPNQVFSFSKLNTFSFSTLITTLHSEVRVDRSVDGIPHPKTGPTDQATQRRLAQGLPVIATFHARPRQTNSRHL